MTIFKSIDDMSPAELYAYLEGFYDQNEVYESSSQGAYALGRWQEAMKPLRTAAYRAVEFYPLKVLNGPVQIVTGAKGTTDPLKDALEQVLTWSNFNQKKQLYLRNDAKLGDVFWKAMVAPGKVYIDDIPAEYVVDFEESRLGVLQSIRIEIPIDLEEEPGVQKYHIEYCDATAKVPYLAVWETTQQYPTPLDELGDPLEYIPLAYFGVDFLNFVHIKYKDVGKDRGASCFVHTCAKMEEADRQATDLAQMVFKNAEGMWQEKSSNVDDNGRPLPPPPIVDASGHSQASIDISRNTLIRLPAGSELVSTIPQINWEAIRQIANDAVEELKQDLPELRYYDAIQGANLSGKALSYSLDAALSRAKECGENFTDGLARVLKMCLTMGQFAGVLQVPGTYDAGDFDFTITVPDIFQPDDTDKAAIFTTLASKLSIPTAMKMAGYSQELIDAEQAAADEAQAAKTAQAKEILNAARNPPPVKSTN